MLFVCSRILYVDVNFVLTTYHVFILLIKQYTCTYIIHIICNCTKTVLGHPSISAHST